MSDVDDGFVEVRLPPRARLARAGFWKSAWQRAGRARRHKGSAEGADEEAMVTLTWHSALDQVRAHDDWQALELRLYALPDFAPPPPLWPTLVAFFADPPRRRRGPAGVHPDVVNAIRIQYAWLRQAHAAQGHDPRRGGEVVSPAKAMSAKQAKHCIADQMRAAGLRISCATVHDIVRRRRAYAQDAAPVTGDVLTVNTSAGRNSPTRRAFH